MGQRKIPIDREKLEQLYIREKRSPKELAIVFSCNRQTIINRLREYDLPVRTKGEGTAFAKTTHHRRDFNGNLHDKAYMIGLRIGDLTVDMANPNGQTIRISCGSTRTEQIELINRLFAPYGHIVMNGPYKNDRVVIQCLVNMTFEFLLPKEDEIPDWIMSNSTCFWAFLGGYSDAEAHIGISEKKASFRLSTADNNIISKVWERLSEFGISGPRPYVWLAKGTSNKQGTALRKDIWRLGIYRANDLKRLLQNLLPNLRHAKRRKDARSTLKYLLQNS